MKFSSLKLSVAPSIILPLFVFVIFFNILNIQSAHAQGCRPSTACDDPDPCDPLKILLTKLNDGLEIDTVGGPNCPTADTPGCDFSDDDGIIKTNDETCFRIDWSYNDVFPPEETANDVTIESPLPLGMNWKPVAGCDISGDGITTPSTLTCVTDGETDSGFSTNFVACANVHGSNPNGTMLNDIHATVSSNEVTTPVESCDYDLVVSAGPPRFNLEKRNGGVSRTTFNGVSGVRLRWYVIVEQLPGDAEGSGTIMSPFTFTDELDGFLPTAELIGCSMPNVGSLPFPTLNAANPQRSVTDSGTAACTQAGPGANIEVVWSDVDTSGTNIPTQNSNGSGVTPVGTRTHAYVAIDIFLSEDDVIAAAGDGNLRQFNKVTDFNPCSRPPMAGESDAEYQAAACNYGGNPEPDDECADPSPTGDNCAAQTVVLRGRSLSKTNYAWPTNGNYASTPVGVVGNASSSHAGNGHVFPGYEFASRLFYQNVGLLDIEDVEICDVIDARYLEFIDRPGFPGSAVYLNLINVATDEVVVEYASGYVNPAWTPPTTAADPAGMLTECTDPSIDWKTTTADPSFTAANPITKYRVRMLSPFVAGARLLPYALLRVKDRDLNGELIPKNTVLPNFYSTTDSIGDLGSTYFAGEYPGDDSTNTRGDRVVLARSTVRVDKSNLPNDATVNHDPLDIVRWRIQPRFVSGADYVSSAAITVTDTLPAGLDYVPGNDTFAGEPITPDSVTVNADGTTTIIWSLLNQTPMTSFPGNIDVIEFDSQVAINVRNGSQLCNNVLIETPEDCSEERHRDNLDCIVIVNPEGLKIAKTVNPVCSFRDQPVTYTIQYSNLATSTDYTDVRILDVFPYAGDLRSPATAFMGDFEITSFTASDDPTITYYFSTDIFPITHDPRVETLSAPDWCLETELGVVAGCPASLAQARSMMAVNPVVPAIATGSNLADLHTVTFEFSRMGNIADDIYTNRANAATPDLSLIVISNNATNTICDADIGNFVWIDKNGNGIQDPTELGLNGVTIKLLDVDTGMVALDQNGNPVMTVTSNDPITGEPGWYLLPNLLEGTYMVEFTVPTGSGYLFTTINAGGMDDDSDAMVNGQTATIMIDYNNMPRNIDAGVYIPVAIGDFVWEDLNANGIFDSGEPAIGGVVVNLLDAAGMPVLDSMGVAITTTTDSSGAYQFTDLQPGTYSIEFIPPAGFVFSPQFAGPSNLDSNVNPATGRTPAVLCSGLDVIDFDAGLNQLASIGDTVWFDINMDGVFDPNESGINGITVNLLDGNGDPVLDANGMPVTTITSNGGDYLFAGLTPGEYSLEFVLPAGYDFSPNDVGDDTLDSDADPMTGLTIPTTLISGENQSEWDAGIFFNGSLGDNVWLDLNQDGIKDPTEPGVEGVTVHLLDGNGDPIIDPITMMPFTTVTDSGGFYTFEGLPGGDYMVEVELPSGYIFSPMNEGVDSELDSDVDEDDGITGTITLEPGAADPTWDAGLIPNITIGDTVWLDENNDGVLDSNEMRLEGTIVNLLDENGNPILDVNGLPVTTVTDANGNYEFTFVQPGTYILEFIPVDSELQPSSPGVDNDLLSTGRTAPIVVTEDTDMIDAGFTNLETFQTHWNGICDQGNFMSLVNGCDMAADVELFMYDIDGNLISTSQQQLFAREQRDFHINDLIGFSPVSYGVVRAEISPPNCVTGNMGLYTPPVSETDQGQVFLTTLEQANDGTCYLSFNTFNSSQNPADAGISPNHWLQLSNADAASQTYTINRYVQDGTLVKTETVTLAPFDRIDLAAGHEDSALASTYGLVEVVPMNLTAPYTAQLFRYGQDQTTISGERMSSLSIADNCSVGSTQTQYLSISRGAGAINWLELSNLSANSETVQVEIYSNETGLVATQSYTVGPLSTVHVNATSDLIEGGSGLAKITPMGANPILAKSTAYYLRSDLHLATAYSVEGRNLLPAIGTGSFNTFLDQFNWLRVYNVSNLPVSITITAYDTSGAALGTLVGTLPATQGQDFNLNGDLGLAPNVYGQIQVTVGQPGAVLAEVVRVRYDGSFTAVKDAISTKVQ